MTDESHCFICGKAFKDGEISYLKYNEDTTVSAYCWNDFPQEDRDIRDDQP